MKNNPTLRGITIGFIIAGVAVGVTSIISGCAQNASTVDPSTAQSMVDHLTYFKDSRTETCYAAVASRSFGEASQNGFTITYVPCTPQVEAEIARH